MLGLLILTTPAGAQLATPTLAAQQSPAPTLPFFVTPNSTLVAFDTPTPTPYILVTPNPTLITANHTPTPTLTHVNFPGPLFLDSNFFNPKTSGLGIHFKMDVDGQAKVSVYNMAGELVRSLVNGYRTRGQYVLYWEGHNNNGDLVGNAIYYIVFQYPGGQTIQKVILLK